MLQWRPTPLVGLCMVGLVTAAGCLGTDFLDLLPRDTDLCETPDCIGDEDEAPCLTWELSYEAVEDDEDDCILVCPRPSGPTAPIAVHFDCTQVHVVSCKDISNVVLEFADGEHVKFDDLDGNYGTFELDGRVIVGVWVKAGNNASGDGPGYGERFDSDLDPDDDCDGTGGTGGMGGGTGGGGGAGGEGGMGGQGGQGGAGGIGACIPGGGAQDAGSANRECEGTSGCGELQVCLDGACEEAALVFVGSRLSTAALGGPRGADQICAEMAQEAGLGGHWMSWTSNLCTSPLKRFHHSAIEYRLMNGDQIAANWADLTDSELDREIRIDENGDTLTTTCKEPGEIEFCLVWTNTTEAGTVHSNNGCLGLTSDIKLDLTPAASGRWTSYQRGWTNGVTSSCQTDNQAIYCFEQPASNQ